MKYCKITIKTNTATSDLVAYFLQKNSVDGVSIYDKRDLLAPTWDYADDNAFADFEEEVKVCGFVSPQDVESALAMLKEDLGKISDGGSLDVSLEEVDDNAWKDEWKKYFKPIYLDKLVVCPDWEKCQPTKGQKILLLDSGIAFGTGKHETTSLILEEMQKMDFRGKVVCDVGCGSGILGLSALLLGAKHAVLVDIDSQATEIAEKNAKENHLDGECDVFCGDLCQKVDGSYDVVLANLTADILKILCRQIEKIVKHGSVAVLSGILTERLDEVEKEFSAVGFATLNRQTRGSWASLTMKYVD